MRLLEIQEDLEELVCESSADEDEPGKLSGRHEQGKVALGGLNNKQHWGEGGILCMHNVASKEKDVPWLSPSNPLPPPPRPHLIQFDKPLGGNILGQGPPLSLS